MGIVGNIHKINVGPEYPPPQQKQHKALDMLGTNFLRDDKLLSQVSSYDIVYASGISENHLEHL